jgi:hypothetical protein
MFVVKDEFFKPDVSSFIAKGTEVYLWRYWRTVPDDTANNRSFVSFLWTQPSENNFFYMLWTMIQKEFSSLRDYYCWRIIANGQVRGQNIKWHTDHGDKTVLYFPIEWNPDWGGSTYFKIDNCENEIHYKQNRLVVFDSDTVHRNSGPKVDNILRVSIAFNLRLKATDQEKATL